MYHILEIEIEGQRYTVYCSRCDPLVPGTDVSRQSSVERYEGVSDSPEGWRELGAGRLRNYQYGSQAELKREQALSHLSIL